MLRIEVVEIDEDGEERDTVAEYTTMWAIEDAQEADYIACVMRAFAMKKFSERADHSPVTPQGGG